MVLLAFLLNAAPTLDDIASSVGAVPHRVTFARLEDFVAQQHDGPELERALLLQAQLSRSDGDDEAAERSLERLLAFGGDSEWHRDAMLELAGLNVTRWRFAAAIAAFDTLAARSDGRWQYQAQTAAAQARSERTRLFAAFGIALLLVSIIVVRLFAARHALWPLTEEVVYAAPLAVLMLIAAAAEPKAEARAVSILALGGLALIWAHSTFLRGHRPSRAWRYAEPLFGGAQALGLLYCAIVSNNLWARFAETLATGAE